MALTTLTPGKIFARDYLVQALIAEGGMGAVYRAEQQSTGNSIALKIMLPELLADPRSRERFEHEARVSGRIRSSHVVKVLAAGIDDATQTPWMAMEFLEGETLATFAKVRGPLTPDVALAVLRQVGHALSAAHAVGVVHCDLKPENIFIAESQSIDAPFDAKVLDFGIARIVKEGRHSATVTTAVGSPHWLAPEQGAKGKTVSPATDVWAFGLIAFWMLTGRFYWIAANVDDGEYNVYSLLGEIAGKDTIVAPRERLRDLGEHRTLLAAGFDGWFLRCVNRDVAARFVSAREAVEGLAAAMDGMKGSPTHGTRASLPSIPVGLTRGMTVGVAGLAPQGYPVAGGTEVIPQVGPAAPRAERPKNTAPVVLGAAVLAAAAMVVAAVLSGRSGSTRPNGEVPVAAAPEQVTAPALLIQPTDSAVLAVAARVESSPTAEPPSSPRTSHPGPHRAQQNRTDDEGPIEGLLAPALGPEPRAHVAPAVVLPERLGRAQITGVLSPLTRAVRSCAHGQPGTAPVAIVIGNDGAVRSATVSGQFAGTPIGECIAAVVRRAHFPAFQAPVQNMMFPYVINPPRPPQNTSSEPDLGDLGL